MAYARDKSKFGCCHVVTHAQEQFWIREFGFKVHSPNIEKVLELVADKQVPVVEFSKE